MVLEALTSHLFEPLENIDIDMSFKVALLLALATAEWVSDIHALSVLSACMQFKPTNCGETSLPNPAFVPKVVNACSPMDLIAFQPLPHGYAEQQQLRALCPDRALM